MSEFRLARLRLEIEKTKVLPSDPRSWSHLFHEWGLSTGPQEAGWVMAFDAGKRVYSVVEVARGTSRRLPIHFPTLLAAVIASGTDRFVFIHSHPGGHETPSDLDLVLTQQLSDAAAVCGLYFEDHFIITDDPNRFLSMAKSGYYVPPKHLETEASRIAASGHEDLYEMR